MIPAMKLSAAFWALLCLVGCTKKNPAAVCHDGTCIDPAYPYCDVDGTVGGEPGTCIAVSCSPNQFAACRGTDTALQCNASGGNYDVVQCPLGCDKAAGGCRLCQPGQTVCTNGVTQTCDASGAIVSSQSCPLGCFEDQPRCRDIDPSNGLAMYLDMVTDPPDVNLSGMAYSVIDTMAGTITSGDSNVPLTVPTFLKSAPAGGVDVRVFIVRKLHIDGTAQVYGTLTNALSGPALAIVATGDISIDGNLIVNGSAGTSLDTSCAGGKGFESDDGMRGITVASGGGGFATPGAAGGFVTGGPRNPGPGGGACGNASLIPLRGGGPAGGIDDDNGEVSHFGAPGGGAVQLSSRTKITVSGIVASDGGSGFDRAGAYGVAIYGGGSGGAILLEAPQVVLGAAGALYVRGMAGQANGPGFEVAYDGNPIPGAPCSAGAGGACGAGGAGASPGFSSQPGSGAIDNGAQVVSSGGGGGGFGRIRINSPDATYTKSNSTIEAGSLTTGTLLTR
jgi:hypothetical protein